MPVVAPDPFDIVLVLYIRFHKIFVLLYRSAFTSVMIFTCSDIFHSLALKFYANCTH